MEGSLAKGLEGKIPAEREQSVAPDILKREFTHHSRRENLFLSWMKKGLSANPKMDKKHNEIPKKERVHGKTVQCTVSCVSDGKQTTATTMKSEIRITFIVFLLYCTFILPTFPFGLCGYTNR